MSQAERFQQQLLAMIRGRYRGDDTLSERVLAAFEAAPRHQFARRFRMVGSDEWIDVDEHDLDPVLPMLYADQPVVTWGAVADLEERGPDSGPVSTISQPSFVLWMLDQLDVQPGHHVFELGTGTGWNAALLAELVGIEGRVVTTEIIEPIAARAAANLGSRPQVTALSIDGADGWADLGPYDRAMFTAGAHDLPRAFHDQVKVGGRLQLVLQNPGQTDTLLLLDKRVDRFEAIRARLSGWVPMTGEHQPPERSPALAQVLADRSLDPTPAMERTFAWGATRSDLFGWATAGFRSHLSLFDDRFFAVRDEQGREAFAWWHPGSGSLAVGRPGGLSSYGGTDAAADLLATLQAWVADGMVPLAGMRLRVYPSDVTVDEPDAWIWRRPESTFVWTRPA